MGHSYSKLTPGHEEAIYELKKAGKSGRETRLALAAGHGGEPPVSVSADRCNKVARRIMDERDDLYVSDILTRPAPEGLRILTRRLMILAENELRRLERAQRAGRLDANKVGRLAGAVGKLHTLLERNDALFEPESSAAKKGDSAARDDAPSPFAASLADAAAAPGPDESAPETTPGDAAPIADTVVKPPPEGPQNGGAHAVPDGPPSHGEGREDGADVRTATPA